MTEPFALRLCGNRVRGRGALADCGAEPCAAASAHRRRRRRVRHHDQPYLLFWQAGEEVEDEKEESQAKPLVDAREQTPQMARMELGTISITPKRAAPFRHRDQWPSNDGASRH